MFAFLRFNLLALALLFSTAALAAPPTHYRTIDVVIAGK
jgi:hypothetical protein